MNGLRRLCRFGTVLVALALGLAGCGTPGAPLKLASDTGVRAAQLAGTLAEFSDAQAQLANLRAENLATTLRQYEVVAYEQARLMEAMRLAGETEKLQRYHDLVASSEKLAQMRLALPVTVEKQRALLLSAQSELRAPVEELNAVAQSLVALGQEMGVKAWLEYYATYAVQVGHIVKEKQKAIDQAKATAQNDNQELRKVLRTPK